MKMNRKEKIEFAIIAVKDAAMLYERYSAKKLDALSKKALENLHKAQNKLYDAIGGMDDYKFDVED